MKPFSTDGCSVISPLYTILTLGRRDLPWVEACIEHDIHYWVGGSSRTRFEADVQLMQAVRVTGYPIIAVLMFIAVRLGGVPWLPFPWRWGFGHKFPYKYRLRTEEEDVALREEIRLLWQTNKYDV